jgi:hypothetical protein
MIVTGRLTTHTQLSIVNGGWLAEREGGKEKPRELSFLLSQSQPTTIVTPPCHHVISSVEGG